MNIFREIQGKPSHQERRQNITKTGSLVMLSRPRVLKILYFLIFKIIVPIQKRSLPKQISFR